jgi:hypothetical protein
MLQQHLTSFRIECVRKSKKVVRLKVPEIISDGRVSFNLVVFLEVEHYFEIDFGVFLETVMKEIDLDPLKKYLIFCFPIKISNNFPEAQRRAQVDLSN